MTGYRDDPEWRTVREDYLAVRPGECDDERLARRMRAVFRLQEIERRHGDAPISAVPAATPRS